MAAIMATIAIILRSIASAPVGGPGGASGRGSATRAAYHSTAPRTSRRKTAVISAGTLVSMQAGRQAGGGTASLASATAREIATDGPVWTTILPDASMLSGKRSIGRGAGP